MGPSDYKLFEERDKFIGDNDFSLSRIKMKVFFVHQGLSSAIDSDAMIKLKESDKDKATVKNFKYLPYGI